MLDEQLSVVSPALGPLAGRNSVSLPDGSQTYAELAGQIELVFFFVCFFFVSLCVLWFSQTRPLQKPVIAAEPWHQHCLDKPTQFF